MTKYRDLYSIYFQDRDSWKKVRDERYGSESSYHLGFKIGNDEAFLFLHPDHYAMIAAIYRTDKKLSELCSSLPDAAKSQYVKENLIAEIQDTNGIEGVISTKREITDLLDRMSDAKDDRLLGMVNRYRFLLEGQRFSLETPKDVRTIYDDLVSDEVRQSDPDDELDGSLFREKPVYLYRASGKVLHEGVTPESAIIDGISRALSILNEKDLDVLVRISIFHYMFGYIHPFYNGNGRVNRFIGSYLLGQTFTPIASFRFSRQIKERKKDYYEAFERTNDQRNAGDVGTFVERFLAILLTLFTSTVDQLGLKIDRMKHYADLLRDRDLPERRRQLLYLLVQSALFTEDGIGISEIVEHMGQSVAWVRKELAKFHEDAILRRTRSGHQILYQADLSAVDRWTPVGKE